MTDPSREQVKQLLTDVQQAFPADSLGPDKWYILAISALVTGGLSAHAATLYQHLLGQAIEDDSKEYQRVVRRLREALFKLVSVVGAPKPIEAIMAIAAIEKEENKDFTFTR